MFTNVWLWRKYGRGKGKREGEGEIEREREGPREGMMVIWWGFPPPTWCLYRPIIAFYSGHTAESLISGLTSIDVTSAWPLHDLCMTTTWHILDICITSTWPLHDLCMISAWTLHDLCMTSRWHLHDLYMTSAWPLHDLYMTYSMYAICMTSAWHLHDLCMNSTWHLHDLCMISAWPLHAIFMTYTWQILDIGMWPLPAICMAVWICRTVRHWTMDSSSVITCCLLMQYAWYDNGCCLLSCHSQVIRTVLSIKDTPWAIVVGHDSVEMW